MASYRDTVNDDYGRPIPGVLVYVFDKSGALATLDNGQANPITTDVLGSFAFSVVDGVYALEFRFAGVTRRQDNVIIGNPAEYKGETGDTGPANSTYLSLATLKAAAVSNASYIFAPPSGSDGGAAAGTFLYQTAGAPYTDDNTNVIKLDAVPLTTGALVRQSAVTINNAAVQAPTRQSGVSDAVPTSIAVVRTQGAAAPNDRGGAPYIIGSMQDASFLANHPDWGTADRTGKQYIFGERVARPDMFRRTTDTSGDDTASFQRWRDGVFDYVQNFPTDETIGLKYTLLLDRPHLIKSPGAIMAQGQNLKRYGFDMRGTHMGAGIIYDPTTPGSLFFNDNAYLFCSISNMTIEGKNKAAEASMWESRTLAGGAPQNFAWDRVMFKGDFGDQVFLLRSDSVNNCSEMSWHRCAMSLNRRSTFLRSLGSDQHLNYWFDKCYQNGGGPLIDMVQGGHVSIRDCDASGVDFGSDNWYIRLGRAGDPHFLGVCQATIDTFRFEQKTAGTKFLRVSWPYGNVDVRGYDGSSQTPFLADIPDNIWVETGAESGAIVTVSNSDIPGKGRFTGGMLGTSARLSKIVFDANEFRQAKTPDEYAVIEAAFPGAYPSVIFKDTNRGALQTDQLTNGVQTAWGCDFGGRSPRKTHTIGLSNVGGVQGPTSVMQAVLPLGAIITRVWGNLPAGVGGGGTRTITITLGDGATVYTGTANPESSGFFIDQAVNIRCEADPRRRVTATVSGTTDREVKMDLMIDYRA